MSLSGHACGSSTLFILSGDMALNQSEICIALKQLNVNSHGCDLKRDSCMELSINGKALQRFLIKVGQELTSYIHHQHDSWHLVKELTLDGSGTRMVNKLRCTSIRHA